MTFLYPFALFALIAIPILIIIYIIRNRYKEETSPSTYLWELSEKFLKRRNPLRKMEHLLALIIQILTIAGLAFALAHPQFTLPGQADNIVFVLDASASMNMKDKEGMTRFDAAKAEILQVTKDAPLGCKFTLVTSGDEPKVIFQDVTDKTRVEVYLETIQPTQIASQLQTCVDFAQGLFSSGKANVCYIATDRKLANTKFEENGNLKLIDVSTDEVNYAITDLKYQYSSATLKFTGSVVNCNGDKNKKIRLAFYCNDNRIGYINVGSSATADMVVGEDFPFELSIADTENKYLDIKSVKAVIEEEDCLDLDNERIVYNNDSIVDTKVLVVSDEPLYLESIFKLGLKVDTTVIPTSKYSAQTGYDITVFDSFNPTALPTEGAVWFFGPDEFIPNSGFIPQKFISDEDGIEIEYTNNNDDLLYHELTKQVPQNRVLVSRFMRYSLNSDFTTILQYNDGVSNIPMVFAGRNENNQRQVVFSFNLHDSSLPMLYDFYALCKNFLNYSDPILTTKFNYEVNEEVTLAISDDVTRVEIETPTERKEPLTIKDVEFVQYNFNQVGSYKINVYYDNNTYTSFNTSVSYPKEEVIPSKVDSTAYALVENQNTKKGDGLFDNILPIVIVASVLFALDWILYAHEQY